MYLVGVQENRRMWKESLFTSVDSRADDWKWPPYFGAASSFIMAD